jgi:hypothetical protein
MFALSSIAIAMAALLTMPAAAPAAEGPGETSWTFKFTSRKKNKPVGTRSVIEPAIRDDRGTPEESDDIFAAAKKSVIRFPRGSRVDTRVPKRCRFTPSQVGLGTKRCPNKTRVGRGAAVSLVGATAEGGGTRINATIDAYNKSRQIIFVVQPCGPGSGPTTGRRCAPAGSVIVLVGRWRNTSRAPRLIVRTPPALLGLGITIVRFELETRKVAKRRGSRSFVTTPRRCRGKWTSSATESYVDAPTLRIKDRQRCRRRPSS